MPEEKEAPKERGLVEKRGGGLVCRLARKNLIRKTPSGGAIVEIAFATPKGGAENRRIGPIDKIIVSNVLSAHEMRIGRVVMRSIGEGAFSMRHEEDHLVIFPPKDVEVFSHSEVSVTVEVPLAISLDLIEAEAFLGGAAAASSSQSSALFKIELRASPDAIASELEKLAQMLRTERPEKGFGTITIGDRNVGKWSIG